METLKKLFSDIDNLCLTKVGSSICKTLHGKCDCENKKILCVDMTAAAEVAIMSFAEALAGVGAMLVRNENESMN